MRKLKRSECAVLHLVLKKKWYDMIASGKKHEEYRDSSPYWITRITNWTQNFYQGRSLVVAFSLGRRKASMWFKVQFPKGLTSRPPQRYGCKEWGEPEDMPHFVIKIGERIIVEDE